MRSGDRVIARDRVIGTVGDRGASTHTTKEELWTAAALGCVGVLRWSAALFQTIRTTLREIFDENAYDRFLLRTQEVRSVDSYRRFMSERELAMAHRPRCC
jgi:hypothetical protein